MELSAEDIVTLRDGIVCYDKDRMNAALAILDRLTPAPEPEVDEATVWTRKVLHAEYEITAYATGEMDKHDKFINARQALSELIASKDAEIAKARAWAKVQHQQADTYAATNATLRASEAALRAENERLRIALDDAGIDVDQWVKCERAAGNIPSPKAAESNPAEPVSEIEAACNRMAARMGGKFVKNERWPEMVAATDTAPVVEVTQGDRNARCKIIDQVVDLYHTTRCEPDFATFATSKRALNSLFDDYRTEAEARGRREALEAVKRVMFKFEDALATAGNFQRMVNDLRTLIMTEGK